MVLHVFKAPAVRRLLAVFCVLLIVLSIFYALDNHFTFHTATIDSPEFPLSDKSKAAIRDPKDITDKELRAKTFVVGTGLVEGMMHHAWDAYRKYAWGADELRPVSRSSGNMFGKDSMLLTIVDSLDTLLLMGMKKEYVEARDFLLSQLRFNVPIVGNMFEINIRVMGGLLSAYALTEDGRLLDKAIELGKVMLANFDETQIFPENNLELESAAKGIKLNHTEGPRWWSLAQLGTFSLEFGFLSDLTGDPVYRKHALAIIERLSTIQTTIPGLYPMFILSDTRLQLNGLYTAGSSCDSFYEYLLKYWLYTGKRDKLHKQMYDKALTAIKANLVANRDGRYYLVNVHGDQTQHHQDHLACFLPGTLALGAVQENDKETFELAVNLTESCYWMYQRQPLGLGPESVNINTGVPLPHQSFWRNRPEVIESIFYMWRFTKDPKYRRWGYEIAFAIEKYAKVETGGYAGIVDVTASVPVHKDRQDSFLFAETLKYLYLLFGPSDVLSFDKWVFNTEAHPFPIDFGSSGRLARLKK
jgi:mannosyl-oligosaccharide alpha-1,2-mannosidase